MIDIDAIISQVSASNQKTVDLLGLLARSNSLLIEYVLVKEVEASGPRGAHRPAGGELQRLLLPAANQITAHADQEPQATPITPAGRQFRKDGQRYTKRKFVIKPGSKPALVVDFARKHGGDFDLATFRQWFHAHKMKPASFATRDVHETCRTLAGRGVFEQISRALYKLKPDAPGLQLLMPAAEPEVIIEAVHPEGRALTKRMDEILAFATRHGGVFSVATAKKEWGKRRDIGPTYLNSTVFTQLARMAKRGLLTKVGPGEYQLARK